MDLWTNMPHLTTEIIAKASNRKICTKAPKQRKGAPCRIGTQGQFLNRSIWIQGSALLQVSLDVASQRAACLAAAMTPVCMLLNQSAVAIAANLAILEQGG